MPLLKTWTCANALFGIWQVDETFDELRQRLHGAFPYDEDLGRLKSPSRRQECVATRVLLARLCGEEKHIGHLPSGKPFFTDGSCHLTISHTKGYVAAGIHPKHDIGVDIEYMSDRVIRIKERFLSSEEAAAMPDMEQTRALLCWTAKETAFKMLGEQEVDFCKHLHIKPFPVAEETTLELFETKTVARRSFLIHGAVEHGFVCTWCAEADFLTEKKNPLTEVD